MFIKQGDDSKAKILKVIEADELDEFAKKALKVFPKDEKTESDISMKEEQ